jgi:hypothetical protein
VSALDRCVSIERKTRYLVGPGAPAEPGTRFEQNRRETGLRQAGRADSSRSTIATSISTLI